MIGTLHSAPLAMHESQASGTVLLVRPASFGFNSQTAVSNTLQHSPGSAAAAVTRLAQQEFDALHRSLSAAGVRCCVVDDRSPPERPDAVFPNNWISLHADGTLVLYPMMAPNRRLERRDEIVAAIIADSGFRLRRRLDLSVNERDGRYLEGTGSLVLDRAGRVAYACRSPRTDESLVKQWCEEMGYEAIIFNALDGSGNSYYHTNVMMWIGTHCVMACLEAVAPAERERLRERLSAGRELLEIDRRATRNFVGNMLELRAMDPRGEPAAVLVMSTTAQNALSPLQQYRLEQQYTRLVPVAVPTIERIGGGSVRCMIAEIPDLVGH